MRGSFHGHCREHSACSNVPLAESVKQYHDIGAGGPMTILFIPSKSLVFC